MTPLQPRAAIVRAPGGPFVIEDVELEPLRADEVRVRMVAAGICHADLLARDQMYPVYLPGVFGHEGAGVVEEVGATVTDVVVGDHVVLGFNSCGHCRFCREGHPGDCERTAALNFGGLRPDGSSPVSQSRSVLGGWFFGQSSFASVVHVPARIAVPVDRSVPLAELAPLGCGFMTGAGAVWNVLRPQPGSAVAILGAGAVGLAALLAARVSGCTTLIVVDVVESRLDLARLLGATHVIDGRRADAVAQVRRITGGRGVDGAIDAAGAPLLFRQMLEMLATRGHGVLVGAPAPGDEVSIDLNPSLGAGHRVSFVLEGDAQPRDFIPRLVDLIVQGEIDFSPLIERFPFAEIQRAVDLMETGSVVKPVLVFEDEGA